MNSLPKRPKRGETEEDLLRQQKQFLTQNNIKQNDYISQQIDDQNSEPEKTIADNHDLPQIVTNIVEKNVDNFGEFFAKSDSIFRQTSDGFPKAVRRGDNLVTNSGKSLFAQHMSKVCPQNTVQSFATTSSEAMDSSPNNLMTTESVISGEGLGINDWNSDINRIRKENEELIEKMDVKEIEEMQRELRSKLSKKTIDFLVNKKKKTINKDLNIENKTNDIEMTVQVIDEKDLPIKPKEVIENKWLNMDVIESDKLLWMRDIEEPKIIEDKSAEQTLSARFDFEANLVDNSNREIQVHSGLYHHQEEESSAGYTIQELYTLIQSKFSSQKVLGLQVLAKLLTKAYNGMFDICFNESLIEQLMKNSALVLVTRVALDDTAETVWRVAINALHAMLCNTIVDELFLDRGFALFSQCLPIDDNVIKNLKPSYDSTKLDELTDEQLMKLDVIYCLVSRTSLLQRIRYLFEYNKSQLDSKSVNDLLDILLRIARHSPESRQSIVKYPYLLDTIVKNFIPVSVITTNAVFSKPNPRALKLIRLLSANDFQTSIEILNAFPQLIEALKVYLTLNPENCVNSEEILMVSIESLRVWISFLSQNLCIEDFWQMFPIVIKQLQYCSTLDPIGHENNFDFQYASTLIFVIKTLVEHKPECNSFNDLVLMTAMNWFTLIKNTVIVPNFDANLCLLSAVEFLLMTQYNVQRLQEVISQTIDSQTFSTKFINGLIENSNLIHLSSEIEANKRDSSNLPSFGSVSYGTLQTTYFMNNESPICLLLAIIKVMKTSSNDKLLNRLDYIKAYALKVVKNLKYNSKLNLFDCYELNLMSELCLFCCSVPSIGFENIDCFLNLSILMICFIKNNSIKRNLLLKVVFNEEIHCFRITENMAELSLREDTNSEAIKESFFVIKALYEKYSDFNVFYWPFDPLLKAVQNKSGTNQEVYDCLTFICLLVKNHRNYFKQMMSSSSALFCLISSVFLISEQVFFDNSVQSLMNLLLKKLLTIGIKCRIEDRVPYYETTGDL